VNSRLFESGKVNNDNLTVSMNGHESPSMSDWNAPRLFLLEF